MAVGAVLRLRAGDGSSPLGDAVTVTQARVLFVDDNALVRAALLGALEAAGFQAQGAGDAAEALEALSQQRFDVVVADYYLPGVTGLELLAAIKGAAPEIPLILYSGGMTDELAAEARDFGVRVVLEKPVATERLVEAVRVAVSRPADAKP
jgi:two-component system, NtrC family, C4-dicarboxylate transport response regulator DctD